MWWYAPLVIIVALLVVVFVKTINRNTPNQQLEQTEKQNKSE